MTINRAETGGGVAPEPAFRRHRPDHAVPGRLDADPGGFSGAPWVPPGNRRITDAIGKLCGLAALFSLAAFLTGTTLLWINAPGSQNWMTTGAAVSLTIAMPWWHMWAQGARIGNLFMNVIMLAVANMQ